MTRRALRLVSGDDDVQFTHAILLVDGDRAGLPGTFDELLRELPRYTMGNRLNILARLGRSRHPRFGDALDSVLRDGLMAQLVAQRSQTSQTSGPGGNAAFDAVVEAHGDATEELFGELGEAVLALAPSRMARLVPVLPGNINLLSTLGWKAIEAGEREQALALYERMLALPIPDDGPGRVTYLRAMNNACVQAHAARAYDTAVRIADRAQGVAHENPNLYHSAACAYAAVGARSKALEMVKLAIEHDYEQLEKLETDPDLGDLRGSPELVAMFGAWRAQKGTV